MDRFVPQEAAIVLKKDRPTIKLGAMGRATANGERFRKA